MKKIIYVLLAVFVLFACKKKNVDTSNSIEDKTEVVVEEEKAVLIQFSKSSCFGKCPTYSVTITEDGMMDYNARANMPLIGEHKIKARSSFASEILEKAKAIKYFDFEDKYDNPSVTDIPSTTLNIQTDKRSKSTYSRYEVPQDLRDLNKFIHEEILKMTEMANKTNKKPIKVDSSRQMKLDDRSIKDRVKY